MSAPLPRVRPGAGVWRPSADGRTWDELFLLAKVSDLRWVAAEGGSGALVLFDLGAGVREMSFHGMLFQLALASREWYGVDVT